MSWPSPEDLADQGPRGPTLPSVSSEALEAAPTAPVGLRPVLQVAPILVPVGAPWSAVARLVVAPGEAFPPALAASGWWRARSGASVLARAAWVSSRSARMPAPLPLRAAPRSAAGSFRPAVVLLVSSRSARMPVSLLALLVRRVVSGRSGAARSALVWSVMARERAWSPPRVGPVRSGPVPVGRSRPDQPVSRRSAAVASPAGSDPAVLPGRRETDLEVVSRWDASRNRPRLSMWGRDQLGGGDAAIPSALLSPGFVSPVSTLCPSGHRGFPVNPTRNPEEGVGSVGGRRDVRPRKLSRNGRRAPRSGRGRDGLRRRRQRFRSQGRRSAGSCCTPARVSCASPPSQRRQSTL